MVASVLKRRAAKAMLSQTDADKPVSFENRFHSRQQFTCRIRLDDITARTRAQGLFRNLSGAVFADEEDFGSWGNFSDSASGCDPIQRRKTYVQQDQVWLQLLGL